MEPLCETSEKGEKLFVKTEIEQIGLEIGRRIVEAFGYLPDSEIAVLLKTNTETVRKFTEDGRLPPTEILLGIHKLTGASLDWLLTGQNAPAKKIVPLRRYRHRKQQSLAA
ncbi:MAG: helix-turn-helix domain-containing protein [Acidobacteria bacterium]|nr:helix-turn-helix domain-containing protein [Acidobacteriota bacterium]